MPFDLFQILLLSLITILFGLILRLEQRARRAELRLRTLLDHCGLPDPAYPAPSAKVIALLQQPKGTAAAIKQYRVESGLGLKEANDVLAAIKLSAPDTFDS